MPVFFKNILETLSVQVDQNLSLQGTVHLNPHIHSLISNSYTERTRTPQTYTGPEQGWKKDGELCGKKVIFSEIQM